MFSRTLKSAVLTAVLGAGQMLHAAEGFTAKLSGTEEVPPINSPAEATFNMDIVGSTITFFVTFTGLTSNMTQAHLHFGSSKIAGGVMIFLCGGGSQPACPSGGSGTFSGTVVAANITGPAAQGVAVGDLAAALEIVGDGSSYANIHTNNFPGGEIRGQVSRAKRGNGRGPK
jgi:hypothetical protein